jgi:acyl transferase domain-containing protein
VDLLCAAAARRRAHLEQRLALTGVAREDLLAALDAHLRDELHPGWALTRAGDARPRLAFVFSGHSGHWVGMGRELLASEPAFGDALRACDRALAAHRPGSLIDDLLAADAAPRWASAEVLQPLVLGIQLALAELWSHWGVTPQAVVGHSMGEIAAACVAGALDPEDAFRICVHRSRLVERLRGRGAMASVAIPLEQLREHLAPFADRIGVAAANSPILTVLSGEPDALRALADRPRAPEHLCPARCATPPPPVTARSSTRSCPSSRAALADLRPRPTDRPALLDRHRR